MSQFLEPDQKRMFHNIVEFARKELSNDGNEVFSRDKWVKCADFGLFAISIPESEGGLAESASDSLTAHYALGYGCADNGFSFAVNNHLIVAEGIFPRVADQEQKNIYSQKLIDGSLIASYAITEADHGSDSFGLNMRAKEVNNGFVLEGSKLYISNATIADVFVVVARTEQASSPLGALSAFIVHKEDMGVTIGKEITKMGLKGCPMGELVLKDCFLPGSRLLGAVGDGVIIGNLAMEWERTYVFASHLGTMQRIMEECVKYVNSRRQFDKTIGSYQLTSSKIVQMGVALEFGQLLMGQIGKLRDKGKNTYRESSMFKYHVGETYAQTALDALQIFGAYGYSAESGVERQVRDALAAKIYSGTSEVQMDILARLMGVKAEVPTADGRERITR
ncbi:acyl-CoA/acyl-ACP dehydrogenase [Paenibacillus polymyxa]|uniref:Acyl-CoA/acyl-ACP dehydrogenase n=1 Tax=Paenibacillus polymyxa TaxID=1406 RepID=A0A8I1LSD0_PAEPO|nr:MULTISPECIES: acyl-CoA dehydrogenase family protein [Paenibacillus]KAF6569872.1 acyl-CoA/acyl-ACP dehydrogenase [Paenibacillus sp. EKM206P]KAF6585407.1 acyl-CoA/acyl-ACP dehydrogenase [Paenibacillus sp. EKM205P]MBM0635694.1 acyl-CoA/acyl-ACP dehydrogenase [Paenibacillus polymyxa]